MKTVVNLGMALWLCGSSMAAQSVLGGTVQEPGLNVTNIETSAGKVSVYLPQNIGELSTSPRLHPLRSRKLQEIF